MNRYLWVIALATAMMAAPMANAGAPRVVRLSLAGARLALSARGFVEFDPRSGYYLVLQGDPDDLGYCDLTLCPDRAFIASDVTHRPGGWSSVRKVRLPRLRSGAGVCLGDTPAQVRSKLRASPIRSGSAIEVESGPGVMWRMHLGLVGEGPNAAEQARTWRVDTYAANLILHPSAHHPSRKRPFEYQAHYVFRYGRLWAMTYTLEAMDELTGDPMVRGRPAGFVRYTLAGQRLGQGEFVKYDPSSGYYLVEYGDSDGDVDRIILCPDKAAVGVEPGGGTGNLQQVTLPRLRTGKGVDIGDTPAQVRHKLRARPNQWCRYEDAWEVEVAEWHPHDKCRVDSYVAQVRFPDDRTGGRYRYEADYVFLNGRLWAIEYVVDNGGE